MNAAALALSFLTGIVVLACAAEKPVAAPKPLRVGHTYSNGNCALNSDGTLTGLCEGSGKSGCITHEPDLDSPPCEVGLAATEMRTPVCSSTSREVVSHEHQCFFVEW